MAAAAEGRTSLLPKGAAGWFLGFLLLWLPVTIWRSADSALAWEIAGYIYFALVGFVALINWPPLHKHPEWLVLLLLMLGVALAVIGPEAFSVNPDKMLDVYQTEEFSLVDPTQKGETINPNILGGALALILPQGLALALRWPWTRRRWLPLLLWAPLLVMGNGLVLSQSRSSWLAVGVAVLLLCWLLLRIPAPTTAAGRGKLSFWRRALLGIFMVSLFVAPLLLWRTGIAGALITPDLQQSTQTSLVRRIDIWRLSLQMVGSNALTGIGLGGYEAAFTAYFPTLPLTQGRAAPPHAHHLFLQLALDLGLPGLLAYLGLWIVLLRALLVQLYQRSKTRQGLAHQAATHGVAIGLSSALVAMLIVGCFDNALWGTKLTFVPWCLFALAYLSGEVENPNVLVT
ncbi:MAG: O-antigen ligase family protein [Caldilineaceae bacterium]